MFDRRSTTPWLRDRDWHHGGAAVPQAAYRDALVDLARLHDGKALRSWPHDLAAQHHQEH
jgi:hypothetical protein